MDLEDKAEWHKELNGGLVPVLETPQGQLVIESRVHMELANELGKEEGLQLYDKDPFKAAIQRQKIEKYASSVPGAVLSIMMYRGKITEKIDELRDVIVPKMENYLKDVLEGGKKFAGGDVPDMVDCFIYPFPSRVVLLEGSPMHEIFEHIKVKENAPTLYAYISRMRDHELFKPVVARPEAFHKFLKEVLAKEEGVK